MAHWLAGLLLAGSIAIFAQTAEKKAAFEAASIKLSDPTQAGSSWNMNPGRLTVHNMSLKKLVMAAYDVKEYQVTGGPKWLDGDRFDIVAKMQESDEKTARSGEAAARLRTATQTLLADRFQLLVRNETKPLSGYSLVTAKSGFQLKPVDGSQGSSIKTGRGTMTAKGVSMERLASILATQLDRPVVDATGIEGTYDLTLEWSPDEGPEAASDEKPLRPSIFTAVQEMLGLRLESQKVPVTILIVERAEKPGEN